MINQLNIIHYQCGVKLSVPLHYLPIFIMYTFSVLFKSASCCLRALFFFRSIGVRSGVMKRPLTLSGFVDDLSFILFFKIATFSSILLKEILSNRGLEDLRPKRKALVIDTEVLK